MAGSLTLLMWRTICLSILLQHILTGSHACRDPRQLLQANAPSFSYDAKDPSVPSHWGILNPNWTTCGTGKAQSPVALFRHSKKSHDLGPLKFQYLSSTQTATLLRSKQAFEVDVQEGWGRIRVEGVYYHFSNFHFHSPSEHTIENVRYDLELHIVHMNKDATKVAVLGILFKVGGKSSKFFNQFWSHLPSVKPSNSSREAKVSIKGLDIEKKSKYWRYHGSLTTPPCSEGVTWTVLKEVKTMSKKQMQQFRAASPVHNFRPLQKLNGRQVTSYDD